MDNTVWITRPPPRTDKGVASLSVLTDNETLVYSVSRIWAAKFPDGGSVLGLSQFSILPQLPLKTMLGLKKVKIGPLCQELPIKFDRKSAHFNIVQNVVFKPLPKSLILEILVNILCPNCLLHFSKIMFNWMDNP